MSDLVSTQDAKRVLGEDGLVRGMEHQFQALPDTAENFSSLVWRAHQFNDNADNKDWIATVEQDDSPNRNIHVRIRRRTAENEAVATDQYSTLVLNEKLQDILEPLGISVGDLTLAERQAGRVGVTDFTKAKTIAEDCISVIRVANNAEGYRALSEEFSHLVIGAFHNDTLVQRALRSLQDKDVLQAILGDEYEATEQFHDGDLSLVAEEALGHLLRQNLLTQVANDPSQVKFVMRKLYQKIRNKFKNIDAERIQDAIIAADSAMGQLAKEILSRQKELNREKVMRSERDAQFNALSDRMKANIEILKKLKDVEIKRYKLGSNNPARARQQEAKVKEMSKLLQGEKDTRVGLYNYGLQAIEELRGIE